MLLSNTAAVTQCCVSKEAEEGNHRKIPNRRYKVYRLFFVKLQLKEPVSVISQTVHSLYHRVVVFHCCLAYKRSHNMLDVTRSWLPSYSTFSCVLALVKKYNQVMQRYYVQYLAGYDAVVLNQQIQVRNTTRWCRDTMYNKQLLPGLLVDSADYHPEKELFPEGNARGK